MSLVSNISDVVQAIGAQLKSLSGRVDTLESDTPTISGATAIEVVSSLPASPDADTIYIVTS